MARVAAAAALLSNIVVVSVEMGRTLRDLNLEDWHNAYTTGGEKVALRVSKRLQPRKAFFPLPTPACRMES